MLAPEQARIALFRISTLGQVPGGEKTDGGATECCMLASHLNNLNTPPPLGKHNIFRFACGERGDTSRIFACGIFHLEVQTRIRHDTSMRKQPEERCAMQEESGSVEFKGDIRDSQTTKIVF